MQKIFKIDLDIKNPQLKSVPPIEVVSGDTSTNIFNINLLENFKEINATGNTAVITFVKSDGTTVFQNLTAVNASKGQYTCTLSSQTIVVPGRVKAEVSLYEGTKRLTSVRFEFNVRKALLDEGTAESSNEFSALTEALAEVEGMKDEVLNNLNTASLSLSNTDSIKSVNANVGSVPKVKIVAPDMLVNLLGRDGDFEVDSNSDGLADGWTKYGSTTVSLDSTNKNTGAKGQRVLQSANETGYISKPYTYIVGNKYYFRAWYYNYAIGEVLIGSQPSSLGNVAFKISAQVGSGVISGIRTAIEGDNVVFLRNYSTANNVDTTWDSVIVVDLTQRYGAGNEPDLAWCDANIRYVNGVQPLLNPCLTVRGKNLVDEKKIVAVGSYIKPTWTGEKLLFDNSSNTAYRALVRFPVFLEKGKTYRVNRFNEVIISGSTVSFSIVNSEGKSIATVYTIYTATYSGLHYLEAFTASGSLQKIELNIQFEEGTVATAYEPYREKQRIYPCTLGKVSTYADELEDDGVEVVKTCRTKKYVLQASDITSLITSGVNVDMLQIKKNLDYIGYNTTGSAFNYNKFIFEGFKDGHYGTSTVDNIANIGIVTGGCDAITFRLPIAKGTYANLAAAQAALAGTEIWYVLAQEEKEIIEPIGSLRLEQGYNCIDVSTGVVYERANFKLSSGYYYLNFPGISGSLLSKKVKTIIDIYKDGISTNNWGRMLSPGWTVYGNEGARIPEAQFDPTADYRAKYEVLHEDYDSQQVNVLLEYADNLRTSHNELVGNVAGLESEVNDVWFALLPIADKEIAMQRIALLTTETTADLKSKVNEILNVWR